MKKILYILLLSPIFALGQCSLPSMYEGVTSSNMMTVNFEYYFNPPSELTEGAYLVALTETGQVVGSTYIYENSESTISVYDLGTYTSVFFQIVTEGILYDLSYTIGYSNGSNYNVGEGVDYINILCGCTDFQFENYNPNASIDDGSCQSSVQYHLDNGSTIQGIISDGYSVDSLYGKLYEGGYIFYVNESNTGGLVLSPEAGLYETRWESYAYDCNGCQGESIGTGYSNNIEFMSSRNNTSDTYAIPYCQDYSYLGYEDWFIPSIEEGIILTQNLEINNIISNCAGSNCGEGFWTSSELQSKNLLEVTNGVFILSLSRPTYIYLSNGTYSLSTNDGGSGTMTNSVYPIRKFGVWIEGCMNQEFSEYSSEANYDNGTCSERVVQTSINQGSTPEQILTSGISAGKLIGLSYAGGVIAHVNPNDGRTIILSPFDTETSSPWLCSDDIEDMTLSEDYFIGAINQFEILENCTSLYSPAHYIDDLVSGGYDDWVYPASNDFSYIRSNLALKSLGDFEIDADNYRYYVSDGGFVELFSNNATVYFNSLLGQYYKNRAVRFEGSWEAGCIDANAVNYNSEALVSDSCNYSFVNGCMDDLYLEYNSEVTIDDGTCEILLTEALDSLKNELEELSVEAITSLSSLQQALDSWNTTIDLSSGWNMFGYGCPEPLDVAEGLSNHTENIIIVKDNNGDLYMPEFGFNGLGDLSPGFGYKIKVTQTIEDFSLCDWYVNDIPEDNIVSLQEEILDLIEENIFLQDENASLLAFVDSVNTPLMYEVGDYAEGGIVFYVDETGEHGLVAAIEDIESIWGCNEIELNGADAQAIGTGHQNTLDIVSGCSETPIAASETLAYESEGYNDWYLPSKDELLEMYMAIVSIGGFQEERYWSSTEHSGANAYYVNFANANDGTVIGGTNSKYHSDPVRPIRSF